MRMRFGLLGVLVVVVAVVLVSSSGKDFLAQTEGVLTATFRDAFGVHREEPVAIISLGGDRDSPPAVPAPDISKRQSPLKENDALAPSGGMSAAVLEQSAGTSDVAENAALSAAVAELGEGIAAEPRECAFGTSGAPHHRVLLNEIAWMGDERSASHEWIELRNNSGANVSLAGWRIVNEDGDLKIVLKEGGNISAGGFFLLERTSDDAVPSIAADAIYSGALANDGEWLKLFDANCALSDEIDARAGWKDFGGENSTKRTLERNVVSFDWHTSGQIGGTPRAQNSNYAPSPPAAYTPAPPNTASPAQTTSTPPSQSQSVPARILVSEILYDAAGSDTGKEFVELYNDGAADVDLKDWSLQSNGSSLAKIGSKPEDKTVIKAHGYFLVGLNGWSGAPAGDAVRSASLLNTAATITLLNSSGATVDSVSYSTSVAEGESFERDSWAASSFHAQAGPTPQNSGI